jgi:hypothetical protein
MNRGDGDHPMTISGVTVIRNARLMGYPVVQAIRSILPIVDEYVVGVGRSDDDTRGIIESIGDPKLRIFDSDWDRSVQRGGQILADKTNEALARCTGDWCFYLQADEVVHERDLPVIVRSPGSRHCSSATCTSTARTVWWRRRGTGTGRKCGSSDGQRARAALAMRRASGQATTSRG